MLTPTRREVSGQTTRLCAYLLRGGILEACGSRRLGVALANPPKPRPKHAGGGGNRLTASGALALVLLALAGIGVVSTLRKLGRRKRRGGSERSAPPGAQSTAPPPPRPATASGGDTATSARPRGGRQTPTPASGNGHAATNRRNGATRAGLRDSGPAPAATDRSDIRRVLRRVTFSRHAIEQFATRAGVPLTSYGHVELLIRELLRHEGKVTTERPFWSHSSNTADLSSRPANGCSSSCYGTAGCHGATLASPPSTGRRKTPGRTRCAAATSTRHRELQASTEAAAARRSRQSALAGCCPEGRPRRRQFEPRHRAASTDRNWSE